MDDSARLLHRWQEEGENQTFDQECFPTHLQKIRIGDDFSVPLQQWSTHLKTLRSSSHSLSILCFNFSRGHLKKIPNQTAQNTHTTSRPVITWHIYSPPSNFRVKRTKWCKKTAANESPSCSASLFVSFAETHAKIPHTQTLFPTGVSLFKKHYPTECYIRSSKREWGLAKMNHRLSHHVKQRSPGTHGTSWHFTQSKKTHAAINTGRSITQMDINTFYFQLYV